MESWIGDLVAKGEPRYRQILGFLEQAILDGRLRPGDRLPPQRRLAQKLGVDLTTVTRAYNEAHQRQLIRTRGPRGTYVAASRIDLAPMVDLSMNIPPGPAGIDLGERLREGMTQVLIRHDSRLLMTYRHGGGGEADRVAGASWLHPMFGDVDPERVMVCPGAQSALAATLLMLTNPGDTILSDSLVYPGFLAIAERFGRRIAAVATDAEGMRPDALEAALANHGARVVYLNPTLHNPTTRTLGEARRRALADVVVRHDARVIEDDPYWRLADDPPPPMATWAPRHTYYLSTLSKCISPGLRVAFTLLPDTQSAEPFLSTLHAFTLMPPPLSVALVTHWIRSGVATELAAAVNTEAKVRRRLARQYLPDATGTVPRGIHLWRDLPAHWSSHELVAAARIEGLALMPAEAFEVGGHTCDAIRISLGAAVDQRQLSLALARLDALLRGKGSNDCDVRV